MRDEEVKALLGTGIAGEPPVRTSIDDVMTAGRRRRARRRAARAGGGLAVAAGITLGVLIVPGTGNPGDARTQAGEPLGGQPVAAGPGAGGPGAFPGGNDHATNPGGRELGETLASLLPEGLTSVGDGDGSGRTYRVTWDPGTGPVEFVGGAERTDQAPQVPLCAAPLAPGNPLRPAADDGEDPALRSCEILTLDDGSQAEVITMRAAGGRVLGHYARVLREDGRTVTIRMIENHARIAPGDGTPAAGDGERPGSGSGPGHSTATPTADPAARITLDGDDLARIANNAAARQS